MVCLLAAWLLPPGGAAAAAPPALVVIDALGRTVRLAAPPQRIVSVAPSVTEILFALGLAARVVGVGSPDDYPPAAVAGRPRVGGVVLDAERILRLQPDLIIGVASLQRGQLERLIALRLPVLAVEASTLPEVYAQILLLGRVTGVPGAAGRVVATMRSREGAVARAVAGRPARRTYVEVWSEPLITAGAGTFLADLITRAGGRNIFADVAGWRQVSAEAVLRRDPEVIILTAPQTPDVLRRRAWGTVTAIRAGRVGVVDGSLVARPGPRIVEGLRAVAEIIHPEAFR
ncbi:MAG TPA: ABC transporter substrate-binding protein [bacterium]|nr:ABC transporter substrate-binding protein [bacterium]